MSKNTQSEHRLLLRPNPVKAPDVPVRTKSGSNPKFYGWSLYAAAILLEWLGFLRKLVWKNAGFASLRDLRGYIENVEPRFDPTVVPTSTHENASTRIQDDEVSSVISRKSSVGDYRALYLSGELTPLDIVRAILPLIRRDTSPPGEHSVAWTEVQVELILDAAKASTLRYKAGKSLGALDGVPAAVKDEFGLRGYKTTFGSAINYASGDAENEGDTSWFVENLEKTGAILMGKVNMHEHGLDTSGNNITFGTPRNPYNSDYYTGGSSSGSAYAIASGLVPIALGSDAGGSIRIPASFCSIYGLKPTHGRLSIHPSPSHSKSCTVYGPMAIDMGSLATLYATICQPHPSSTFASLSNSPPTSSPLYRNPRTKLLGIPEHWLHQATPSIQNLCHATIQKLISEKGYTAIPIHIPFLHEGQIAHAMTVLTDAAVALPNTRDLSPANRVLLAVGGTTPASDYILAQKLRHVMMRHLAWLWEQYPGMLVVSPTTACAGWPIRTEQETVSGISDGDATMQSMKFVWLGNFCGCPGISVPVGFVVPEGRRDGGEIAGVETQGAVPVGMMAMGEWGTEEQLIGFGMDVEDLNGGLQRKPGSWVDVIGIAGRLKGDGVASS